MLSPCICMDILWWAWSHKYYNPATKKNTGKNRHLKSWDKVDQDKVVYHCSTALSIYKLFLHVQAIKRDGRILTQPWLRWLESWEGLLLGTDVSTTCAEPTFRIKSSITTLKMTSAQVVKKSVAIQSPSQCFSNPNDHFQSRYVAPGFKPFSYS